MGGGYGKIAGGIGSMNGGNQGEYHQIYGKQQQQRQGHVEIDVAVDVIAINDQPGDRQYRTPVNQQTVLF